MRKEILLIGLAVLLAGCGMPSNFSAGGDRMAEIGGNEYYPKMYCYFEPYGIFDISSEELDGPRLSLTIRSWLDKDIEIWVDETSDYELSGSILAKNGTVALTFKRGVPFDAGEPFFKWVTLKSSQPIWFNAFGSGVDYIELRCSNMRYGEIIK